MKWPARVATRTGRPPRSGACRGERAVPRAVDRTGASPSVPGQGRSYACSRTRRCRSRKGRSRGDDREQQQIENSRPREDVRCGGRRWESLLGSDEARNENPTGARICPIARSDEASARLSVDLGSVARPRDRWSRDRVRSKGAGGAGARVSRWRARRARVRATIALAGTTTLSCSADTMSAILFVWSAVRSTA